MSLFPVRNDKERISTWSTIGWKLARLIPTPNPTRTCGTSLSIVWEHHLMKYFILNACAIITTTTFFNSADKAMPQLSDSQSSTKTVIAQPQARAEKSVCISSGMKNCKLWSWVGIRIVGRKKWNKFVCMFMIQKMTFKFLLRKISHFRTHSLKKIKNYLIKWVNWRKSMNLQSDFF